MNFEQAKKIHFIAIGGIGVSALAQLAHSQGKLVTGSDLSSSEITKKLSKMDNLKVTIGSHPELINKDIDLIVHSPAVPKTDAEYQRGLELNIPILSYPQVLGQISLQKKTIAISGTNGKTTTTSMIVESFKYLNINPTVIIGGVLQKYNSNFINGNSEYFITEACEYKRSFLSIHHDIAVITNITEDHLDYFEDLADIQSAFIQFINNKKGSGIIVCNMELKTLEPIILYAKKNGVKIFDYSKYLTSEYILEMPGEHNRQNMAAALSTLEALNLDVNSAYTYLSKEFLGTKRRMEYVGRTENGAYIYDDYAHNPEGISFLFDAIKTKFPTKKIIALFEPHLYSRTEDFKEAFREALSLSDILYLFPVYKAREPHQPEKDFILEPFINRDKENYFKISEPEKFIEIFSEKKYDNNYVVITIGAGDIWEQGLHIKKQD